MAISRLPFLIPFPPHPTDIATTPTITTTTYRINSATDYVAAIFDAPDDIEISKIKFRTSTVTTGCTVDVRLETVSAGLPTNTLWGTNTNKTQVVANTDDNVTFTVDLTANATISRGETLAIVIRVSSGTPSSLQISAFLDAGLPYFPYLIEYDGSATIIGNTASMYGLYDVTDGWLNMMGSFPASTFASYAINTTTTPDVIGNWIDVVEPIGVAGCWFWADLDGDCVVSLRDASWNILASKTLDTDTPPSSTSGLYWRLFDTFPNPTVEAQVAADGFLELPVGEYFLEFSPTEATNVQLYSQIVATEAEITASIGGGRFRRISAKDPTDETDVTISTVEVTFAGLVIAGISDGAGGGGGGEQFATISMG
jgi:hypothetical protein